MFALLKVLATAIVLGSLFGMVFGQESSDSRPKRGGHSSMYSGGGYS